MSLESNVGWGQGAWTALENVHRPHVAASSNSHHRQEMDLNRAVIDFSSQRVDCPALMLPHVLRVHVR